MELLELIGSSERENRHAYYPDFRFLGIPKEFLLYIYGETWTAKLYARTKNLEQIEMFINS